MSDTISLGSGREFDVIRDLVRRWGSLARGIGDDAAVLEVPHGEHLVASTDATVENVHFRREWLQPSEIGYRAAAAALSDLAAMAATPLAMLVAIAVPNDWRSSIGDIAEGIGEASRLFGAPITGGNLTGGTELALTVTVLGHAARPLGRNAARAGDRLYVTGALGGPRRALERWESGAVPLPEHRQRFAHPTARVREGLWLAAHGATAAIDVSDGLVSDVGHLSAASGVDAVLDFDAIPVLPGVSRDIALASGEEYELVVASPVALDAHAFAREFALPLTAIGVLRAPDGAEPRVLVRQGGRFVDLPRGHDHFSR